MEDDSDNGEDNFDYDEQDDDEEREEERAAGYEAWDRVDGAGAGKLAASKFGAVFGELGTTYSEEGIAGLCRWCAAATA